MRRSRPVTIHHSRAGKDYRRTRRRRSATSSCALRGKPGRNCIPHSAKPARNRSLRLRSLRDWRRDLEVDASAAREELERLAPPTGERNDCLSHESMRCARRWRPCHQEEDTGQLTLRDDAEAALRSAQEELQEARDQERISREAVDVRAQAVTELSVGVRTLENTVE